MAFPPQGNLTKGNRYNDMLNVAVIMGAAWHKNLVWARKEMKTNISNIAYLRTYDPTMFENTLPWPPTPAPTMAEDRVVMRGELSQIRDEMIAEKAQMKLLTAEEKARLIEEKAKALKAAKKKKKKRKRSQLEYKKLAMKWTKAKAKVKKLLLKQASNHNDDDEVYDDDGGVAGTRDDLVSVRIAGEEENGYEESGSELDDEQPGDTPEPNILPDILHHAESSEEGGSRLLLLLILLAAGGAFAVFYVKKKVPYSVRRYS